MKVLLDTNAFIWWDSEPQQLSNEIVEFLLQPDTVKFVSVVSLWEIQIKSQLGKLTLNQPLEKIYHSQSQNGVIIKPTSSVDGVSSFIAIKSFRAIPAI